MRNGVLIIIIAASILFGSLTPCTMAQDELTGEYRVKAAFLYNFAKFVTWPEEQYPARVHEPNIILGILGDDPFGDALETIRGKNVKGKKLVIKQYSNVENIGKCHMLFICSSEKNRLDYILNYLKGANVLTVGDMEQFAGRGGIVHLVRKDKKIKFRINVQVARTVGLKISSQLLKLAEIIGNSGNQP